MPNRLVFMMSDGSEWAVDARTIAEDRADYLANELGEFQVDSSEWIEECVWVQNDFNELADWATNNMDWDKLKACMIKSPSVSYAKEFMNAPVRFETGHA